MKTHQLERCRRIKRLNNDIHGVTLAQVGDDGATRIEVTMERGQMSMVPWFAVYEGDHLREMYNAAHVSSVHYFPPGDDDGE